jgi:DNA-directed RNA polymerase subunit beta'
VTLSRVRRERMGHIELAVPVSHIWFYKCMPSRIGLMLDITARQLERIIYYEDFLVTDVGTTNLMLGQLLTETELREAEDAYGETAFRARMGAEAIQDLLSQIDLPSLMVDLAGQLALLLAVEQGRAREIGVKPTEHVEVADERLDGGARHGPGLELAQLLR